MISMYFQKSRIFTKNNKRGNGWIRDGSIRFCAEGKFSTVTGSCGSFIEDDFGIKKHGIFLRVRGSNQKFSAAEFVDQIDDGLLCRGIQSSEWFVHEDNFGRREECAEDGKTPLHSAGEFADRFFERICGEKAEK